MPTHWEVTGGGEAGGIVVREGKELQSKALDFRLATGAVVLQVEAVDDRVHYYLVMGQGPPEGWVSVKTKSTTLLKERDITVERWFLAIKEIRAKKKDAAAAKLLVQELTELSAQDQRLPGGMVSNGMLEAVGTIMKAFPEDKELQGLCVELTGNACLFNEYASRKAGKAGVFPAALAYVQANRSDRDVQAKLGSLGCYLDYCSENRQLMADCGGFRHCLEMCELHAQDAEVCFAALCAASNPSDHYPVLKEAGVARVLTRVANDFVDDKVRSEAGMVAKGCLNTPHVDECAADFGKAGLGEAFLRALREHLGSRPVQANCGWCVGHIARCSEQRLTLGRAGAIDVLLAVIQENTRCPGFCWGLAGMEDNLWRVLDNAAEALLIFQHESLEFRTAMIRAGAVRILQAALAQCPSQPAHNLLQILEESCRADASLAPRPRTRFEGRWIMNTRPTSLGILTIAAREGGGLGITQDDPGQAAFWNAASVAVDGVEVRLSMPTPPHELVGRLVDGRICWQPDEQLIFYPFLTLED